MQSDNYVVIQGWMVNELKLKGNDLLVFALIHGFTQDGKTKFAGGRTYIAESFNISLPTVDKALQNLIDLNYITKIACENQADTDKYFSNISSKETLLPKNISSKETLPSNISNNQLNIIKEDNNITNKEDTYNKNKEQVIRFVEDFNKFCPSLPRCIRMTAKRSKGISNLLKKYSYDEILKCFEKLEASDFCTGRSGRWRADIDFILREDKFINVLEGKYDNQGKRCNVETISHGEKKQMTEDERERIIRNGKKF